MARTATGSGVTEEDQAGSMPSGSIRRGPSASTVPAAETAPLSAGRPPLDGERTPAIAASPAVATGADAGRIGTMVLVWLPPVLLVLAWAIGRAVAGRGLEPLSVNGSLVPAAALLALRPVLELRLRRTRPGDHGLTALYALHLLLVAAAVILNPLMCIYAFVGYLDSGRFLTGRAVLFVLAATALVSALGQVGGAEVAFAHPAFYALLALVNLGLAGAMTFLSGERERMIDQREAAVRERDRVTRENAALHEQLMARARESGVAEERARLSREIHDTVAQGLVGVIRQLEAVGDHIDPATRYRLAAAEDAARDSLLEARRAVEALGPHQLQHGDVIEALGDLVARWARARHVVATFDADDAPRTGEHSAVLVRIVQEALANVARHAEAGTVTITLVGDEHEHVLRIADDGEGFDPDSVPRGHGLANMSDRLRAVGGSLTVLAEPGRGCTVTARVPR
ncbi:sensor histidine kinase [Brachybacterium sp. GCM10030268]|uniref:sensor histidine kinase n=1 Tax=Brachybacterium sp. GCM10030268 TaxID=3273382 RepID=UPI0036166092